MSRKCPKRNHLFLNWLKANRSRFLFEPRVLRFQKRQIDISFKGITSSLGISVGFTVSGGPWITVYAVWPGKENESIVQFYGAEKFTSKGWTSRLLQPESHRYWRTKEELWTELCFEEFLRWCYSKLTLNSVLELYELNRLPAANIHKDFETANNFKTAWENELMKHIKFDAAQLAKSPYTRMLIIPVIKHTKSTISVESM